MSSLLNEVGDGCIGEMTFEGVPAFDLSTPALEFQVDEGAQTTEEVVLDGSFPAHEELLRSTDLFDGAVVALDAPVLPVDVLEVAQGNFQAVFFRGSYAA